MGRRKRERKLLEAAAMCSLDKLQKILGKDLKKPRGSSKRDDSDSDSDVVRKKRRRRDRDDEGVQDEDKKAKKHRKRKRDADESSDSSKGHKRRPRRHVDVNCSDYDGWTPLHHAAYGGAQEVVHHLLRAGAEPLAVDLKGNTPLHVAARRGHAKVISALREAGGDMARENDARETPSALVRNRLREMHTQTTPNFEERLQEEREGWGVWGDETEDAAQGGSMSQSGKGWDWFGEERAHRAGLSVPGYDDDEEVDPEDAWRDGIAEEMASRRRKQEQDAEEAFLEKARREWEEMKRKKAAKEQESQRILEEEQKKDRAWRDSVQKGGVVDVRKKYEKAWDTFAKSSIAGITLSDIPFPVSPGQEGNLKDVLLVGCPVSEHRKRIREEVLRWHPDKFMQKWGKRLLDKQREAIAQRVKEVSQAIQDVYFSLGKSNS